MSRRDQERRGDGTRRKRRQGVMEVKLERTKTLKKNGEKKMVKRIKRRWKQGAEGIRK